MAIKWKRLAAVLVTTASAVIGLWACTQQKQSLDPAQIQTPAAIVDPQTPTWNTADREFFLHGSMSSEIVPEYVLKAFVATYPELFRNGDWSRFGLIPQKNNWPIGFSIATRGHLAKDPSVGVNCAACHTAEIRREKDSTSQLIFGVTSHFDADAFFSAIVSATFLTQDPVNMKRFLHAVLDARVGDIESADRQQVHHNFDEMWNAQELQILATIQRDPAGAKWSGEGGFNSFDQVPLLKAISLRERIHFDCAAVANCYLKLFHNMRTTLHIPDVPPHQLPPPPGPGRNDAFGLLSAELFGKLQPPMPVKFGVVWNVENRKWVHWDGNTRSPLGRNLLASIGLGAPLIGNTAKLDFAAIQRHTDLTEKIRAPKYPWPFDVASAARGRPLYDTNCAKCHTGDESDQRYFAPSIVGTDAARAELFTAEQADRFNKFLSDLKIEGYTPAKEPGLRSTQKYLSPNLAGVWARSPYLHNGSVRTMADLLKPADQRPPAFKRGSNIFDETQMGYTDAGTYTFETKTAGNSNAGHEYGTKLTPQEKRDLIEFLKSL